MNVPIGVLLCAVCFVAYCALITAQCIRSTKLGARKTLLYLIAAKKKWLVVLAAPLLVGTPLYFLVMGVETPGDVVMGIVTGLLVIIICAPFFINLALLDVMESHNNESHRLVEDPESGW